MVEMVDLHGQLDITRAREYHNKLLIEASERLIELKEEHVNFTDQIYLAWMAELALGENEELLLEHEQLIINEWDLRLEDLHKRQAFWQKRHKKLEQYNPENFINIIQTKLDTLNVASDRFNSPDPDLDK